VVLDAGSFVGGFFGPLPPMFENFMVFPFVVCLTALEKTFNG
jgi:hypothetical protein